MAFCGNVVELVEESKVIKDEDFIKWTNTNLKNNDKTKNLKIEVYVEKQIIPELEEKPMTLIDAAIGTVQGEEIGMLHLKKSSNVYG